MHPLIESNRATVAGVCRQFHVRRLEVFGSASQGDFDPQSSDLDFLIEFEPDSPQRALDAFFGLKEALESVFGRPVDLVVPEAVTNPYVRAGIEKTRQLLYAA